MYLHGLRLAALGFDPSAIIGLATSVASAYGRSAGGGAASIQPPSINVQTTTQTTVSPQISPNFIQQQSPSNSPVNAATVQESPAPQSANQTVPTAQTYPAALPVTGAIPGVDSASGYLPTGTPMLPAGASPAPVTSGAILAAGGILLGAVLLRKGKRKGKRSR